MGLLWLPALAAVLLSARYPGKSRARYLLTGTAVALCLADLVFS